MEGFLIITVILLAIHQLILMQSLKLTERKLEMISKLTFINSKQIQNISAKGANQ